MNKQKDPDDENDKYTPEWAQRAKFIDHKPEWVDKVDHRLWILGDVFFPMPNRQKYRGCKN